MTREKLAERRRILERAQERYDMGEHDLAIGAILFLLDCMLASDESRHLGERLDPRYISSRLPFVKK